MPFSVEGDTADSEEDGFEGPDEEDGEDGELGGPGVGNGEANGVEGPPGNAVVEKGEEGHDSCADAKDGEAFPTDAEGAAHLADGGVVGEGAGAGEGVDVEVEGTVLIAQPDGEEDVCQGTQQDDEEEGGDKAFAVFANEIGQAGNVCERDHEDTLALRDEAVGEAEAGHAGGGEVA